MNLCTIHKEKCYISIYLQKAYKEHCDECTSCLNYVLPLADMAKIFKSGTVTLSDII